MATFHVDYLNGSNSNDGSAANPYATVVYAIETNSLTTGDTVKVAGSAPTLVENAATLKGKVSSEAQILQTTSDLTGSISVGDIVKIYPNGYTDFQEMRAEVTSISATEIQFYESLYLPGTIASTYAISTLEFVDTTSGTFEQFNINPAGQVLIEGGYNSTFTSIIGRTNIRRSGLGSGSSSGTCIKTKSLNNNVNTYQFENFGFYKWQKCIEGEFGGSHFLDNIVAYMCNNRLFANYGNIWNYTGKDNGNLYLINCDNEIGASNAYWTNFVAAGFKPWFNVQSYTGQKFVRFNGMFLNNVTNWNGAQNSGGTKFGSTALLKATEGKLKIRGGIKFNGIGQAERSGFYLGHELFFPDAARPVISGKLTYFTQLLGGVTDSYYQFSTNSNGETGTAIGDITMPAGYDLMDEQLKTSNSAEPFLDSSFVVRTPDDGFAWKVENGSMVTVDNAIYDTGSNSKRFFIQSKGSYAVNDAYGKIFAFENTGTKPTSITLRCRMAPSNIAGNQTSVRIVVDTPLTQMSYIDTPYQTVNNTTGWQDYTFTFGAGGNWDLLTDSHVTVGFTCSNSDLQTLWIDSATVNY